MSELLVTTKDNKWSPFTHYKEWVIEDARLGHNTPGLLSRLAAAADEFNDNADDYAFEALLRLNPNGLYIAVSEEDFNPYLDSTLLSL